MFRLYSRQEFGKTLQHYSLPQGVQTQLIPPLPTEPQAVANWLNEEESIGLTLPSLFVLVFFEWAFPLQTISIGSLQDGQVK